MSDCIGIQCCPDSPFQNYNNFGQIPVTTYYNTRQCSTAVCPDGSSSTECVEPGLYSSTRSQLDADNKAKAAAYDLAIGNLGCKFTSTQTACITCQYTIPANQVPKMTSNTTTSDSTAPGTCFGSGISDDWWLAFNQDLNTHWASPYPGEPDAMVIGYGFPAQKIIKGYIVTLAPDPGFFGTFDYTYIDVAWRMQGSNDGLAWIDLDTQPSVTFSNLNISSMQFTIANTTAYSQYRIHFDSATYMYSGINGGGGSTGSVWVAGIEFLSYDTTQVCQTASAVSIDSQADADAKATAAALALCQCPTGSNPV